MIGVNRTREGREIEQIGGRWSVRKRSGHAEKVKMVRLEMARWEA